MFLLQPGTWPHSVSFLQEPVKRVGFCRVLLFFSFVCLFQISSENQGRK